MTVLRSTKWEFIGECWGYLVFQNRRFPDQKIFVKEAKYVNMKTQAVHIMKAKSIGDSDSDIPYQKRHFSEYRG